MVIIFQLKLKPGKRTDFILNKIFKLENSFGTENDDLASLNNYDTIIESNTTNDRSLMAKVFKIF